MKMSVNKKIYITLRIAIGMCFLGHGAFGIITKAIWCNYFAVFGIDRASAYQLMPWVGTVDIALGLCMLVYPVRFIPVWLVMWGFLTAALRPLSGEPFPELIERAGNFGAPLILILVTGGAARKNMLAKISPPLSQGSHAEGRIVAILQFIAFLILAGHGWLNLLGKKSLLDQYIALGFADPQRTSIVLGIIEILAAFSVFVLPSKKLIGAIVLWKIVSELFYPHHELFEWIERGGSYGCLISLWIATNPIRGRSWKENLFNVWSATRILKTN
ncbi:MAG TPA: hypothetical protein VKR32_16885 [Puia sp.]|nr:hypothetical protein [Puia sp.]